MVKALQKTPNPVALAGDDHNGTLSFNLPGLGDGGGLRGGFDETVVDVIKGVNFEGVAGADWFSSGTLSRMVLAFSSWTSLENFSKID